MKKEKLPALNYVAEDIDSVPYIMLLTKKTFPLKDSIEKCISAFVVNLGQKGDKIPEAVFMSFPAYAKLVNGLGHRVQFVHVRLDASPDTHYEGVQLLTGAGRVVCLPDRHVASDKIALYF